MAFDTRADLRGGAAIPTANHPGAATTYGPGLAAPRVAPPLHDTGTWYEGFDDGHVSRHPPPGGFASPVVARARDLPRETAAAGVPDTTAPR